MRTRPIWTVVLTAASGLSLIAAPAAGQPEAPPARRPGMIDPAGTPGRDLILVPYVSGSQDKELIGLSEQAPAELLTWDRAYTLALVRARSADPAVAETLDPQALAEQARRHGISDFARFRKDFLASLGAAGGTFHDPAAAYLAVLRRLQAIDHARQSVAAFENLSRFVHDLVQGSSSGLSQLDVALVDEALLRARRRMSGEVAGFRDALDELKVALGLSPHAAVLPDRQGLAGFRDVLKRVDAWSRQPDRYLGALPRIVERLPDLGDEVVNGRPILRTIEQAPTRMEDVLRDFARLAIRNRSGADRGRATGDDEIALELRVRRRIRRLLETRRDYEDQKRGYVQAILLKDQAFERLVSPPSEGGHTPRTPVIQGLIDDLARVVESEDRLVALWASFRAERLALYRDLGTLPYDNWDAFYDDLAAGHGAAAEVAPPAGAAAPAPPAEKPNP